MEDMPSFLTKKNCPKRPHVLLFGITNSGNISNHSSTKNFGKFQCKSTACGRDDLFFLVFTCYGAERWKFADLMTFILVFTCF